MRKGILFTNRMVKREMKDSKNMFKRKYAIPAIFLGLSLIYILGGKFQFELTAFDRIIGDAVIHGVDIENRINWMYLFSYIIIPGMIGGVWFVLGRWFDDIINHEQSHLLNILSTIGLSVLILIYFRYNGFETKSMGIQKVILPFLIVVSLIIYLKLQTKIVKFKYEQFIFSHIASIPIVFLLSTVLYTLTGSVSVIELAFLYIACVWGVFFILIFGAHKVQLASLQKAYVAIMSTPIVLCVFLELCNILNQHNIIIRYKGRMTVILYGIMLLFTGFLYWKNKKNHLEEYDWRKVYYPVVLVGCSMVITQLPLQTNISSVDFFETANHGTVISELFRYGKLPIIETFDAHMLTNSLGMILYQLFNQDVMSAIYLGYSLEPVVVYLYYRILCLFFTKTEAFLFILLFPIYNEISHLYWFGFLIILVFVSAYKQKTMKSQLIFWFTCAAMAIYRLDLGYAFILASIMTWGVLLCIERNWADLKRFLFGGAIVGGVGVTGFVGLCLYRGVNPIERLKEFLLLSLSNLNWSYVKLGDMSRFSFTFCYVFMPVITVIALGALIHRKLVKKAEVEDIQFIVALLLFGAYFFNFSRGIVRHSLAEGHILYVLSLSSLFLCLVVSIFVKRQRYIIFVGSSFVLIIFNAMLLSPNSIDATTILNSTIEKQVLFEQYENTPTEKVERVVLSDHVKECYEDIRYLFDTLLEDNETYLDFINQTLFYSLLEREKPVYVNQSPGLLSGEVTQQQFLNQINSYGDKVVFALLPYQDTYITYDLDEVRNSYRYYLVSEYISNNFVPFLRNDKYAIWCRKDRIDEMTERYLKEIEQPIDMKVERLESDRLVLEDLQVVQKQGELHVQGGPTDPKVLGLEEIEEVKQILQNFDYMKIQLKVSTEHSSGMQLFYTTEENEDFNEQNSIYQSLEKSGTYELYIPCTDATRLRWDFSSNSNIVIQDVVLSGATNYSKKFVRVDYEYAKETNLHEYKLAKLPYLWGTYDERTLKKKEVQETLGTEMILKEKEPIELSIDWSNIEGSAGNYIYTNISSQTEGEITIVLGNRIGETFTPFTTFSYQLNEGNNMDYLVRVSSDFMWYSGQVNAMQILTTSDCMIEVLQVLKGDTLEGEE